MLGCHSIKGAEPEAVGFIIIWMLSRSPTNPVLYYINEEARSAGVTYAKKSLDIYNIRSCQLSAEQLKQLKRIAFVAPDRGIRKAPPYYVIEIGSRQATVVAYSMNRETLLRMIHVLPLDAGGYIQLMYDAGSQ